jgi:diguanylate cyclase (GGDEF)-like protein
MVTVLVAASAAVLGVVVAVLVTRLLRTRAERRLHPVRARIDEHVQAISRSLERVAALAANVATERRDELDLELDLEGLLEHVVQKAAALTGAQAVAIRVEGAGGTPVVASVGASDGTALLETALGPPDARPFRALTISWTYGPAVDEGEDAYSSALVVPVVEEGATTGALVAYATPSGAFQPEHLRILRDLADDAAPGIANARRFAELGQRSFTDPVTGIRNRSGYELELEREVERAHRSGRPLSLVLVELRRGESAQPGESELHEFAALLKRTVRATDIPCRRRTQGFAVVLPETGDDGARRFYSRLREGLGPDEGGEENISAGLVEWRPNETSAALDARAAAAVVRSADGGLETSESAVPTAIGLRRSLRRDDSSAQSTPEKRDLPARFLEHVGREVDEARRRARPLAVVAIEIDELRSVEERIGEDAAEMVRAHVAARIDESADEGGVVSRLDADRFAVLLPRASASAAQSMLAVLQASLDVRPPEGRRATISAGISVLSEGDDAAGLLRSAEHALQDAQRTGAGTVVVAGSVARP